MSLSWASSHKTFFHSILKAASNVSTGKLSSTGILSSTALLLVTIP